MIRYFSKSLQGKKKQVFSYDLPINDDQGKGSLKTILRQKRKKNRREIGFPLFNRQNHLFFVVNVQSGEVRRAVHFDDR